MKECSAVYEDSEREREKSAKEKSAGERMFRVPALSCSCVLSSYSGWVVSDRANREAILVWYYVVRNLLWWQM